MPDALQKMQPPADGPAVRRYAVALSLASAALLLGTLAFNVAIDPRSDFHPGSGLTPLVADFPAEELALLHAHDPAPQVLVLGSSRMHAMPPANATALGGPAFNFAVSGGGLEDAELVYDHYVRWAGHPPAAVVLGVDTFSVNEGRELRILRSAAYEELAGEPRPARALLEPLPATLSWPYVADSLRVVAYTLRGYPDEQRVFDPDGLEHRPPIDARIAAGTYPLAAIVQKEYAAGNPFFAGGIAADPVLVDLLQDLVARMLGDGVEVHAVLPPFQHAAYAVLRDDPAFAARLQLLHSVLAPLCGAGLHLHDFTDPSSIGLDPAGFYDGHHVTPANGAKVLDAAVAGQRDACVPTA